MASDFLEIEILNWEKYNPKRDQKTYTWLRLDNGISTDPELFGLDAEQRYVWIVLLCQASQQNSGRIRVAPGFLEHITGVSTKKIAKLFEFLQRKPVIKLHDRARSHDAVVTTPTYERTNERTNETNERDERDDTRPSEVSVELNFESVAQEYPNPRGRSEGVSRLKKLVTTPDEFERFSKAVRNYAEQCRLDQTEQRFIKHFSSFVGSDRTARPWGDWVEHLPVRSRSSGSKPPLQTDRNEDLDAKIFGGEL